SRERAGPLDRVVPARVVDDDHAIDEVVGENLLMRAFQRLGRVVRRHHDHDALAFHHRARLSTAIRGMSRKPRWPQACWPTERPRRPRCPAASGPRTTKRRLSLILGWLRS